MPTPTKGTRLGGSPTHERIILANLATQLFEHGRITTTETKAKRLRPLAEKLITKARRGDLHNRRQVLRTIRDTDVVHILFTEIGPAMEGREGGYTRITKIGPRKGDNAPMAIIEIITDKVEPKVKAAKAEAPAAASVEDAGVEEDGATEAEIEEVDAGDVNEATEGIEETVAAETEIAAEGDDEDTEAK